jgi:hypothetical protein
MNKKRKESIICANYAEIPIIGFSYCTKRKEEVLKCELCSSYESRFVEIEPSYYYTTNRYKKLKF